MSAGLHYPRSTRGLNAPCRRRRFGAGFRRLLELLRIRYEHARRRRELMEMPDYLLRDMGVTRDDIYRELHRPRPIPDRTAREP